MTSAIQNVLELLATGAIIATVVLAISWSRRRLRPSIAAYGPAGPASRRTGLAQRVAFTVVGGGLMIPDLLVPVFGEVADLVIAIVLAYAWYTYYAQPGVPVERAHRTRDLPAGVDECVRCSGSGFSDGKIDPLCAGRGWVPGRNRPG